MQLNLLVFFCVQKQITQERSNVQEVQSKYQIIVLKAFSDTKTPRWFSILKTGIYISGK